MALEVNDICDTTITVRQGVWNGIVQSPKTSNGLRGIDADSSLSAILKEHIGARPSGFLFPTASGNIIYQSNIRNRSLHPILRAMGREKCGFHSFCRFRVTHLRKNRSPEDLLRFWIGHADRNVTDGYSKVKEDVAFQKECAENLGLGFDLPKQIRVSEPKVVPRVNRCQRLDKLFRTKGKNGAPGEIRTPDLLVRSQTLYPAELRAHR